MSIFLRRLFLIPLIVCSLGVSAAPSALPSPTSVQIELDRLADSKLPEAEIKAAQRALQQTLDNISEVAITQRQLLELTELLQGAPHDISELQHKLAKLSAMPQQPANVRFADKSLNDLEQLLNERSAELNTKQRALSEANTQLINAQTRPERAQTEASNNQIRRQKINGILKSNRDGDLPLSNERREQLKTEMVASELRNQLLQDQLLGNNLLQDLANSQRELLNAKIKRLEQDTLDLQNLISDKRREASQQTVSEITREAQLASPDSLLAQESSLNLKYSDYLLRSTERLNFINRLTLETSQQQDTIDQAEQSLQDQIKVLKGNLLLSKILYQQKQALPVIKLDSRLGNEIADIRLYQFELNQVRGKLSNLPEAVEKILAAQPPEQVSAELRDKLTQQLTTRVGLLDRISREVNALLNASVSLQLSQKQLLATSRALNATLDEQMFWVPSNLPLNLTWLKLAPSYLEAELSNIPVTNTVAELRSGLVAKPLFFLPLLLLIAALLWWRKAIQQKLQDLHQDIGHFKRDSQLHTPRAILLNLFLSLPISLFLALGGLALLADERGNNPALGLALIQMALAWLLFATLYRLLSLGGVAELHFRWERRQVAFLRRKVQRLGFVVLALVAIASIAEQQPSRLAQDVVGLIIVISCLGMMAWLTFKMLWSEKVRENASAVRMIVGMCFVALPLSLIIAIGFGYFYTALKLTDRLIDTLYLLMFWVIIEATVVRGLSVAARRLAYQRALSKRQSQAKEGAEGGEAVEEPVLDIEQVNQQSMRLIRLLMLGVFLSALYWLWADLLSAFTYLDNVTLYEYTRGEGATASLVPISVFDVMGAMTVLVITVVLARNLPGLLEMLVLSKLNLAQGSAYAVTTLLSYSISAIGFVSTLGALGVSWDKLQWLVAALSVGLGFGLQEIFANFISGLIILFERPVRIGDTVTIGPLSGTVSRIRIRATTITDFDRKEIIVPNKTFVTDQLINWSLTDTVTRMVLVIGLAYEADLDLARKLMRKAIDANSRVLRDPEPQVFFIDIGASTFNFNLRFHVYELADRLPAGDEILTAIAMSFREHNIEMAFNQLDVFVKNPQSPEVQLSSTSLPTTTPEPDSQ